MESQRPQRLESLCLSSLAQFIATRTLDKVLSISSNTSNSIPPVVKPLRTLLHSYAQSLPDHIFVSLLDAVRFISPNSAIYVDLAYADRITSYPKLKMADEGTRLHFSSRLLEILPLLPAQSSLTELNLSNMDVNDDILRCLAAAPIAGALKSLKLNVNRLSDATADCWLQFNSMELLEADHSKAFGLQTIQSLGKLPHLHDLSLSQPEKTFDSDAAFKLIFSPDSFNGLTRLGVSFAPSETPNFSSFLLDLISKHPNRERITKLRIYFPNSVRGWPLTLEGLERLCELCPNLQELPLSLPHNPSLATDNKLYFPPLRYLRTLVLTEKYPLKDEIDLQHLCELYPDLERFYISKSLPRSVQRLDYLCHLHTLHIRTDLLEIKHWPSSLRVLSIVGSAPADKVSTSLLDEFVDSVCQGLRLLQTLTLAFRRCCPSAKHIQQLLIALNNLSYLEIASDISRSDLQVVEVPISHPNLLTIPLLLPPTSFAPHPVWMPRLQRFEISSNVKGELLAHSAMLRAMPNLSAIQIESLPEGVTADQIFFQCLKHHVSSIKIGPLVSLSASDAKSLCKLRFLNHLDMSSPVPTTFAASLLKNLLLLSLFAVRLNDASENNDSSWFRHARLRDVALTSARHSSNSIDSKILFELSGSNLPLLQRIEVNIMDFDLKVQISASSLLHLDEISIRGGKQLSLCIEKCPALSCIKVEGQQQLGKLKLGQLPRLKLLSLPPVSDIGQLDCDVEKISEDARMSILGVESNSSAAEVLRSWKTSQLVAKRLQHSKDAKVKK